VRCSIGVLIFIEILTFNLIFLQCFQRILVKSDFEIKKIGYDCLDINYKISSINIINKT